MKRLGTFPNAALSLRSETKIAFRISLPNIGT
jgi:hypothetical protein